MKNSTKGAIAAAAAGSLLLGGAGSLAYWTSTGSVSGASITSGTMTLSQTTGQAAETACTTWSISYQGATATDFTPGTDKIIPGDVLTKTCNYTIAIAGKNLKANLTLATPTLSSSATTPSALVTALNGATAVATNTTKSDAAISPTTDLDSTNNGDVVKVVVSVPFATGTANTDAQGVTDTLNSLAVTLTQKHS